MNLSLKHCVPIVLLRAIWNNVSAYLITVSSSNYVAMMFTQPHRYSRNYEGLCKWSETVQLISLGFSGF